MNENRNQLFHMIEKGNANGVRYLLTHGGVNINTRDPWNRTPLKRAIAMGHVNIVRMLIQMGARVHQNNLGFILRYMNNENSSANNRELKNIISRALGRQARARRMTASLREGLRLRRIYREGLNAIRRKYPRT